LPPNLIHLGFTVVVSVFITVIISKNPIMHKNRSIRESEVQSKGQSHC
jgi:hypothetical protein